MLLITSPLHTLLSESDGPSSALPLLWLFSNTKFYVEITLFYVLHTPSDATFRVEPDQSTVVPGRQKEREEERNSEQTTRSDFVLFAPPATTTTTTTETNYCRPLSD